MLIVSYYKHIACKSKKISQICHIFMMNTTQYVSKETKLHIVEKALVFCVELYQIIFVQAHWHDNQSTYSSLTCNNGKKRSKLFWFKSFSYGSFHYIHSIQVLINNISTLYNIFSFKVFCKSLLYSLALLFLSTFRDWGSRGLVMSSRPLSTVKLFLCSGGAPGS